MVDAPGPGAASVASELLAFYREPARFRPHYLHGDAPLPEGHVVLKLALGRFAPGWRRDLPHEDQEELSEAARAFVRQVCLWERATHYQVLCLDRHASRDAIRENYRLLMALLHPDRQDAALHEWPADCAQRVNDAYAVLSDDGMRRDYDDGMRKAHVASPPFEPSVGAMSHRARPRRRGFVRAVLVVTAVLVALFVVQSWWMGTVPQHYALLERAMPLRASAQWVRDVLPTDLPRFMDSKPAVAFDPIEMLAPSRQHYRLASVSVWTPGPAPAAVAPEARVPAPAVTNSQQSAPIREQAVREPLPVPALRLAQAPAPSAVVPPAAAARDAPRAPTTEEVELLVAGLVSYYEAGDNVGLESLFFPDSLGFWRDFRRKATYLDFFRDTTHRRLRINRLNGQRVAQSVHLRGDATVLADYIDGRGKVERPIDIEIDISVRDGQARITRLFVFPESR